MNEFLLGIIFLIIALILRAIHKSFNYLPMREVKRRAEKNDATALKLYKSISYSGALNVFLWTLIALSAATGMSLVGRSINEFLAILILAVFLFLAFSFIPATRLGRVSLGLTKLLSPLIAWLLSYLHAPLSKLAAPVERQYQKSAHTRLFEADDILRLLNAQKKQPDNRISKEEIESLVKALKFGKLKAIDVLTPRKEVKTILAADTIGPILIDELHKSGQDYVLVKDEQKGQVVGTLAFARLGIDSRGIVSDHMDNKVYFANEKDSLAEVIKEFFRTKQTMFVVIDGHEKFVGIISIEDIIKHLVSEREDKDGFDDFTNPDAVASRHKEPPAPKDNEDLPVNEVEEMVE